MNAVGRWLKVEPDASADQLLTNLLIAVAGVQGHIADEFVFHEGFPCSFPLSLYIREEENPVGLQPGDFGGRFGPHWPQKN
jgi:hypothetical protein